MTSSPTSFQTAGERTTLKTGSSRIGSKTRRRGKGAGGGTLGKRKASSLATTPAGLPVATQAPINATTKTKASTSAAGRAEARDKNAILRRRREVRAARDKLSELFEQLRRVLPGGAKTNAEPTAKAQVLEQSVRVIEQLMERATFLSVELAVASPRATRAWVHTCANGGQRPIARTVAGVMKLFATRKDWRYAEWWTLDERHHKQQQQQDATMDAHTEGRLSTSVHPCDDGRDTSMAVRYFENASAGENQNGCQSGINGGVDRPAETTTATTWGEDSHIPGDKPAGVLDDLVNAHGCVVRDSTSVMRLTWTLVHRRTRRHTSASTTSSSPSGLPATSANAASPDDDENALLEFARQSQQFEFRPRVGMPGRVWTSRRAEWLTNLHDAEVFIRSPLAERFGMETCLAVPIQFGGHVHSVMAFFSQHARPYDPDTYDLACTLAQCIEDVYSPNRSGPWITTSDALFPSRIK